MTDAPIPAATLVILRDAPDGPPDILMVERARAMAFAGGAMVFPGGRIDPDDHALALTLGGGDDMAARVAAIRETIEEVGIAIGLDPVPSHAALAAIRRRLHEGEAFGGLLAAYGTTLRTELLVPFARWRPDHPGMRNFDTMFFLAAAPQDARPSPDATETARYVWTRAAALLADADAGRARIIYPTRRTLERLAQHADYAAAVADARAVPVRTITPFVETRGGVPHLCIPDDRGYPVTAEPISAARRD